MLRKGLMKNAIYLQFHEIRQYNRYGKRDMVVKNMAALKMLSLMGLVITTLIFALSQLDFENWEFMWRYWVLLPMYAVYLVFSFVYGKKEHKSFTLVRTVSVSFPVILLIILSVIGTIFYPDRPDELFVFVIVLLPLFLSIETWVVVTISLLGGLLYCVLAYIFKSPGVLQHDIFSVILSVVLSMAVLGFHARLRAQNFLVKEKYKTLSRMDLLTELLNKKSYELWCQRLINECASGELCSLAIFDLDNFKQINDTYGHIMGDKVLEIVGQTLSSNFQADCFVGRVGGDEFSAFTCSRKSSELFERRAENVMTEVMERSVKELRIDVTMSMGISVKISGSINYMDLYFDADKALYEFKRSVRKEKFAVVSN
ncbi:MAG: GGDEF domain-containing protein [Oscillospiraceae bacterium]|nr:GGDEF domain-containing protein [Oscillospiraceae bacterium]